MCDIYRLAIEAGHCGEALALSIEAGVMPDLSLAVAYDHDGWRCADWVTKLRLLALTIEPPVHPDHPLCRIGQWLNSPAGRHALFVRCSWKEWSDDGFAEIFRETDVFYSLTTVGYWTPDRFRRLQWLPKPARMWLRDALRTVAPTGPTLADILKIHGPRCSAAREPL
jgi:hypothetical protein